jgi:hypothetical protein
MSSILLLTYRKERPDSTILLYQIMYQPVLLLFLLMIGFTLGFYGGRLYTWSIQISQTGGAPIGVPTGYEPVLQPASPVSHV